MKKIISATGIVIALATVFGFTPTALAQGQWYELTPNDYPDSRLHYDMVADGSNHIILFGGRNPYSTFRNDTWSWDGNNWTELAPATPPSKREGHTMSYDPVRDRIVLFSGWDGYNYIPDTWEWDGAEWTKTAPTVAPPKRDYSEMVFDPNSGTTIMFGGHDWWEVLYGIGTYGDMWSWDGSNWTQLFPVNLPPPRMCHCMVYDKNRGTVILFSGWQVFSNGTGILHNDMWEWNGSDWTQLFPGTLPPERAFFSMAYDDTRSVVVIHGGHDPDILLDDTWEWDGSAWTQAPSTGPAYGRMSAAYDATRQEILIQGGATTLNGSTAEDKTWAYTTRLMASATQLSARTGGSVDFKLDAGADNADRMYALLGSISGTDPGTILPGGMATLPLNWDLFTDCVWSMMNTAVFMDFLGKFDAEGKALSQLNSNQLHSGCAGIIMHYGYALNNPFDFVSNPIAVEIVP